MIQFDVSLLMEHTGQSTVFDQITNSIQAGLSACDIRNPQGSCCLGNVRGVIKQLERENRQG